jgi:cobalamin synthase
MPTHGYRSTRQPPTFFDHILAHCFELAISVWAIQGGLQAIIATIDHARSVSPSLDRLPTGLAALVGLMLVLGGGGIIHGLFDNSDDLMVGFRRERMGLVLKASGWASYGACIIWISPTSILSWSLPVFMVAACLLRIEATRRTEAEERKNRADGY